MKSFIKVDIENLIECCEKFIRKRNKERAEAERKGHLKPCRPEKAIAMRNMAMAGCDFFLSYDDFIYLEKEVCPKELHKLRGK